MKEQAPLYVVVLLLGGIVAYDHFAAPKTAPAPPDRLATIATAYLHAQPAAFRSAAEARRKGTATSTGELLKASLTPSASEIQAAVKSAPNEADALDSIAKAMEGALK